MLVSVRVFGYLVQYCDKGSSEEFVLDIPENSKPMDLLRLLGIPEREVMLVVNPGAKEHVLAINDVCENRNTIPLKANDTIWIYPFLAGG
jgi:hypothetical protein